MTVRPSPESCTAPLMRLSEFRPVQRVPRRGEKAAHTNAPIVSHSKLDETLFSGQSVARVPAADAIRDLRDEIRPILKNGSEIKDLIQNRPGRGYVLNLPASEILLIP